MYPARPQTKVIFLTGAPAQAELSPASLQIDHLLPPVERFVNGKSSKQLLEPTSSKTWPDWRSLNDDDAVGAGKGKRLHDKDEDNSLGITSRSGQPTDVNQEFLEHSLLNYARNEKLQYESQNQSFADSSIIDDSFVSNITNESMLEPLKPTATRYPLHITNLKGLPSPISVEYSYPQTITKDLLVGIISISAPRAVSLRTSAASMRLVEVVVGDETRTGFSITFWLPPTVQKGRIEASPLEVSLKKLRSGHIVLLTNVALRVFRGKVYGCSQKNHHGRSTGTTIERLNGSRAALRALPSVLSEKRERVARWVLDFLPAPSDTTKPSTRAEQSELREVIVVNTPLPPDTQ